MKRNLIYRLVVVAAVSVSGTATADNLLFIGGEPGPTRGDDSFVFDHLEELGHDVTYLAAIDSDTSDADGMDAIVISSTVASGNVRGKFQDAEIGILQWEYALIPWEHANPDGNFRMSELGISGEGTETTIINIVESAVGHPLTAGLEAGEHEIFDDINRTPKQLGQLAPGLIRIAELDPEYASEFASFYVDEEGNEVEAAELVLSAIDEGGELGPEGEGFFAPARRVNFPLENTGFDFLNDTGLKLFDCSLEWVLGRNCLGDEPGVEGDFNDSGARDVVDLDLLATAMGGNDSSFDLTGDGSVDFEDRLKWVVELTNTFIGDANFDGQFNSSDFVTVFGAAKYETDQPATWAEGDWNGDGKFNSSDFVAAFGGGGYELGPREGGLMVVPEPSSVLLLFGIGAVAMATRRRR